MAQPWIASPGGLAVTVRLTPRGGRDAIEGVDVLADASTVLKARVRAAPSDGAANAALLRLLARALDVALRRVRLTAGASARVKRVTIEGDATALAAALAAIVDRGN